MTQAAHILSKTDADMAHMVHFLSFDAEVMIMICSPLIVLLIDQSRLLQEIFLHVCSVKSAI